MIIIIKNNHFKKIINFICCVQMFCLHMCKCATGAPGACRGQKGVLDPLELKFGWLWATMWLGESNLGPLQEPYF